MVKSFIDGEPICDSMNYTTETAEVEVHLTRIQNAGVYRTKVVTDLLKKLLAHDIVEKTEQNREVGTVLDNNHLIESEGSVWILPEENAEEVGEMYMNLVDQMLSEVERNQSDWDNPGIETISVDV